MEETLSGVELGLLQSSFREDDEFCNPAQHMTFLFNNINSIYDETISFSHTENTLFADERANSHLAAPPTSFDEDCASFMRLDLIKKNVGVINYKQTVRAYSCGKNCIHIGILQ